jgi:hypothetical protein
MVKIDGTWVEPKAVVLIRPTGQGGTEFFLAGAPLGHRVSKTVDEVFVALGGDPAEAAAANLPPPVLKK